jgi:hypothetical protein
VLNHGVTAHVACWLHNICVDDCGLYQVIPVGSDAPLILSMKQNIHYTRFIIFSLALSHGLMEHLSVLDNSQIIKDASLTLPAYSKFTTSLVGKRLIFYV